MTLSLLLRNPKIEAVAVDPNKKALIALEKSLKFNKLAHRALVINKAVDTQDHVMMKYDPADSVTGHISENGPQLIETIGLASLINKYQGKKRLIKIDIEGYETKIIKALEGIADPENIIIVIELHPKYFNGIGNPTACLSELNKMGYAVRDLDEQKLSELDENNFTQVYASKP